MDTKPVEAKELLEAAQSLYDAGEYPASIEHSETVLEDVTLPPGFRAKAYHLHGMSLWYIGDYRGSAKSFKLCVELMEEDGDTASADFVQKLSDYGLGLRVTGDFEAAFSVRERALKLAGAHSESQPQLLRAQQRRLAQSHHDLGHDAEAEVLYLASHPKKDDGLDEHISWLNSVAIFYEGMCEIRTAIDYYEEIAETIIKAKEPAVGIVAALGNAAQMRIVIEDWCGAADLLRRMRNKARGDNRSATRLALIDTRYLALAARGRIAAAERLARSAVSIQEEAAPGHSSLLERRSIIADLALERGDIEAAYDILYAALRYPKSHTPEAIEAHISISKLLLREGKTDAAKSHLTSALCADTGSLRPVRRWEVFRAFSETATRAQRPDAAILYGKMAISEIRRTAIQSFDCNLGSWVRSRLSAYDEVLNQLALQGRFLEACNLQIGWLRPLGRFVGVRQSVSDESETQTLFRDSEAAFRDAYLSINSEAYGRQGSDGQLPKELRERIAGWVGESWDMQEDSPPVLFPQNDTAHPSTLRKPEENSLELFLDQPTTRADQATLYFLPKGDGLMGVLADARGEDTFDVVGSLSDLVELSRRFRTACADPDSPEDTTLAVSSELNDYLITPISDRLAGIQRLNLSLWSFLSFVPFAALHDGQSFLVERHALARLTGSSGPKLSGELNKGPAAVFADSGSRLNSIPNALREAESISKAFAAPVLSGPDFTAESLRAALARHPRFVHIASHFNYRADNPVLSALALGDGTELSLEEFDHPTYDLNGVDLLVLSCCSTAISDSGGFGFEGFAGLAQSKGARNVVGSLWEVRDLATRTLMERFYHGIAHPSDERVSVVSLDPVDQLANAQRELIAGLASNPRTQPVEEHIFNSRGIGAPPATIGEASACSIADWAGFSVYS